MVTVFVTMIDKNKNIYVAGATEGGFDNKQNLGDKDIFLSKWKIELGTDRNIKRHSAFGRKTFVRLLADSCCLINI